MNTKQNENLDKNSLLMDTFYDAQGNPAYTVKEGGTLKKRL